MATKAQIEAEVVAIHDELGDLGPHGNLMTPDGFPRADIDIMHIRAIRHRLACLQTDHMAVMKQIEELLPLVFEVRRQRKELRAKTSAREAAAPVSATQQPRAPAAAGSSPVQPASFARTDNAVRVLAKGQAGGIGQLPAMTLDTPPFARVNAVAAGKNLLCVCVCVCCVCVCVCVCCVCV